MLLDVMLHDIIGGHQEIILYSKKERWGIQCLHLAMRGSCHACKEIVHLLCLWTACFMRINMINITKLPEVKIT